VSTKSSIYDKFTTDVGGTFNAKIKGPKDFAVI
jgi:hypothetical protein